MIIALACGCRYLAEEPDASWQDSPQVAWCPRHGGEAMRELQRRLARRHDPGVPYQDTPDDGVQVVKVAGDVL